MAGLFGSMEGLSGIVEDFVENVALRGVVSNREDRRGEQFSHFSYIQRATVAPTSIEHGADWIATGVGGTPVLETSAGSFKLHHEFTMQFEQGNQQRALVRMMTCGVNVDESTVNVDGVNVPVYMVARKGLEVESFQERLQQVVEKNGMASGEQTDFNVAAKLSAGLPLKPDLLNLGEPYAAERLRKEGVNAWFDFENDVVFTTDASVRDQFLKVYGELKTDFAENRLKKVPGGKVLLSLLHTLKEARHKELDPAAVELLHFKKNAVAENALLEYAMGAVSDWRLGRHGKKDYMEMRSKQLTETLDAVALGVTGKSLREQISAIWDAKMLETNYLEIMMHIRNKKRDGEEITAEEIHAAVDQRQNAMSETLARAPESLLLGNAKNPQRETILSMAIKHFREITGEKITPRVKN